MFGLLRKFNFSFIPFLIGGPRFVVDYVRSRQLLLVFPAAFAVFGSAGLVMVFLWVSQETYQETIHAKYTKLAQQAIDNEDPAADIYFARLLTVSDNPQMESFQFAKHVYESSRNSDDLSPQLLSVQAMNADTFDPSLRRALMIMQSLAPRRHDANNYPPAHSFLAGYWRSRDPQSETTQMLALQHDVFAAPEDKPAAIALANKLARHNYHVQAIEALKPHQSDSDVLMLMAASYSKSGDIPAANRCLEQAVDQFRAKLVEAPDNVTARINLSRCVATQGRILESMFVLVEGYSTQTPGALVDQLIQRYTIWLQLMSRQKAMLQLNDIALALKFAPEGTGGQEENAFAELRLSTGEAFSLPTPIVQLHKMLLNGEGRFLAPLLLGTEKTMRGEFEDARGLLEEARQLAPDHPVIENNLAWTLLKKVQSETPDISGAGHQLKFDNRSAELLDQAFVLACAAVEKCPEVSSFRATKGIIAAHMSNWKLAVQELRHCVESGDASAEVHGQLRIAEQNLTRFRSSRP